MDSSQFDYDLPAELIAQFPVRRRDQSRLLILDRENGRITHEQFGAVCRYLNPGDLLIVNDTRVFKARLIGKRSESGKAELLLIRLRDSSDGELWEAMARPSRRLKPGQNVFFGDISAELVQDIGGGRWLVRFKTKHDRQSAVSHFGHVPLPPYISRQDQPSDVSRYQTLFADSSKTGAVAAPTAGFHFTKGLIGQLTEHNVRIAKVTLHVGPGTFRPLQTASIDDHLVEPEWAELPVETARAINQTRSRGGKVIAVGTTSVRTLESARLVGGEVQPFSGMVDLYIKPGHRYRLVDHLITNFHLPKSSLLVLVAAFAGREKIMKAYHEAISERYRFYSYGDAMLIL